MTAVKRWNYTVRRKQVEIYELDYENGVPKYYLWETVTEKNKELLKIMHFPEISLTFEELFDEIGGEGR